jgi:hypothetical protein
MQSQSFFMELYGHKRISAWLKRDVRNWPQQRLIAQKLAPAAINTHLAALSPLSLYLGMTHNHRRALLPPIGRTEHTAAPYSEDR